MIEHFQASDGYRFALRRYPAAGSVRGRLVVAHGIRSHGGWYERSSLALAEAGYEVHVLDRRGSGLNGDQRGDCPDFQRLLDDVREYVRHLKAASESLPVYLAGISWGGKTVLGVEMREPGLARGIALVCPGLQPAIAPPLFQRLRILLASQFRPGKRFPIPLNDPELFTSDREKQRFIEDDPLGLEEATARFLFQSHRLDRWLKRHAHVIRTHLLLLLAGQDRIIDNARTRRYLCRFTNALGITVRDYPGCGHTLEFEPVQQFVPDLAAWMNRLA